MTTTNGEREFPRAIVFSMSKDQITLGRFIKQVKKLKKDEEIFINIGGIYPTGIESYRGYYDELALTFTSDEFSKHRIKTAGELLKLLESAIGKTFTGYKGGDFVMNENTPVWLANYGNTGDAFVTGVDEIGQIIIGIEPK